MAVKTTGVMRTIPANNAILIKTKTNKRRVCGYARVSTGNEEQKTSYKSQVDYYTELIKKNPKWEFVGLFSDEGISGTSTKKRDGFKKMISQALSGQIDLIITKSISRFARNTVDSLSTIRKLKDAGVEVYFEKENIKTFDQSGELMLSILSSLSQEESRSISTNVQWGIRKRFADGYVRMRYHNFMGYEQGKDGKAKIVEKDAKVIRLIYKLFLEGYGYKTIAKRLMDLNIKSPGNTDIWRDNTIKSILTNERYIGDALLQKTYTIDFLEKKSKKNDGEVPQYYVEGDHPAIINKETFNAVQEEIKNRVCKSADNIANKVICGYCGGRFGKKVWHSNSKYRKCIYQCNNKFKNHCESNVLTEKDIEKYFMNAFDKVITNKNEIIENIEKVKKFLDTKDLIKKRDELTANLNKLVDKINKDVYKSAETDIESKDLYKDYDKLKLELENVNKKIISNTERKGKLDTYIKGIKTTSIHCKFSKDLFGLFVDEMVIYNDKVIVKFNDGTEVEA